MAKTIPIEWLSNPIHQDDLPGVIVDELRAFIEIFEVDIDPNGYVVGKFSPADVATLGYKMLAWTKTSIGAE